MSGKLKSQMMKWGGSGVAVLALALMWNVSVQNIASADVGIRITFAAMDANEDGVITKGEFESYSTETLGFA